MMHAKTSKQPDGTKLSPEDVARLKACFDAGISAIDAQAQVGCSIKAVWARYARWRGNPYKTKRRASEKKPEFMVVPKAVTARPSRFYTSNFEPT